MSSQSPPPPPGRDGPAPAQGGRPQPQRQWPGPGAPAARPNPNPPGPQAQSRSRNGAQPGQGPAPGQRPGSTPRADRPTTFIPKVDETDLIPRVEDFGAVSQGTSPAGPDGFPTTDPDAYQPRHGSFTPPAPTPPAPTPRPAPKPAPPKSMPPKATPPPQGPPTQIIGPTIGARLGGRNVPDNEQTVYFGADLTSQFAPDFATEPAYDPGPDRPRDPAYANGNGNGSDYAGDGGDSFAGHASLKPPPARERGRTTLRTMGEVLITAGMVVLLFVVYELYITDIFSAQKQANATTTLDREWDTVGAGRSNHYDLTDGSGIAKLYIPAFGQDYVFTVIEGDNQNDLAIGPGHYPGTALPGQAGNFAVAGHRVGEGAPFDDLGLLQSCDSILIETQSDWYVYRVLPMAGEVANWSTGQGATAQCQGPNGENKVQPLTGLYAQTVGQEIVLPTEGDVVAPVPHHFGVQPPAGQELPLLTLTTCNPKFSAAQRMIIHAILVKDWQKTPGTPAKMPPEMKETS